MGGLFQRLFRIARASLRRGEDDDPETYNGSATDEDVGDDWTGRGESAAGPAGGGYRAYADYPVEVVEDLAVFGLTPPSSLETVRRARNREIKKCHSDRFFGDPEKFETSKKLMQIYNAAYDRLKIYYKDQTG